MGVKGSRDARRVDGATLVVALGDGSSKSYPLSNMEARAALTAIMKLRDKLDAPPADTRKHRLDGHESRMAYRSYKFNGHSIEEVARIMGCTEAAVVGAINRCEAGRYGRIK